MPSINKGAPLFSVVLPVYNGQEFIAEAIESVLNQNFKSMELIVVNDGSTDNTENVLKTFEEEITYLKQDKHGPSHARNRGVEAANGAYISFIDADDVWVPNCLTTHFDQIERFKNLDISLGLTCEMSFSNVEEVDLKQAEKNSSMYLSLCAVAVNRTVFDKVGFFDEELILSQDIDWFFRARDNELNIAISRKLVLLYRRHLNNRTNDKKMSRFYLFKLLKKTKDRRAGSQISLKSIMKKPENQDELIEKWHSATPNE